MSPNDERIERLVKLGERLIEAIEADIAALKAGKPQAMRTADPEIQKLSALYGREAQGFNADTTKTAPENTTVDQVLMAMAELMRKVFRASDIIGRIDELRFAVLLADCTDEALGAIEGVRAVTDEATPPNSNILTIAMVEGSVGTTFDGLMKEADLRIIELRKRDAEAARPEESDWSLVPNKPGRPAKRRTRNRR